MGDFTRIGQEYVVSEIMERRVRSLSRSSWLSRGMSR
jgi:hypothetical protein